ncbi:MAG: hypothetical protein J2P31_01170 [Blastocatellia bacterium]|nr:hypothetical protein [Blastocatellia bacterium]
MAKKKTKTTKKDRSTIEAHKKQRPKFAGAKSAPNSYEFVFEEIQKPECYGSIIMKLRGKHRLHEFVEWALKRLT